MIKEMVELSLHGNEHKIITDNCSLDRNNNQSEKLTLCDKEQMIMNR